MHVISKPSAIRKYQSINFLILSIFSLLVFNSCSSLMYYPSREIIVDPARLELDYEDIWFTSASGDKIHAWWFASRKNENLGTIVQAHGNAENLSSHYLSLVWLIDEGYNLLIFDYPGYGQSSGEPDPKGTVLAAQSAMEWAAKKDSRGIIVYGQSLGGAISLRAVEDLKNKIRIRALILDSTFDSYQRIGQDFLGRSWITWLFQPFAYVLLSDKWAVQDIKSISPIPVLIIHGTSDKVIPLKFGQRLKEKMGEPKDYWQIQGGNHIDVYWREEKRFRPHFVEWLRTVVKDTKQTDMGKLIPGKLLWGVPSDEANRVQQSVGI